MIKAVIFDLDNTLFDFMKMKKLAVESAVDSMIDAGLEIPKEEMVKKIYEVYEKEGIEDQKIFDKTLEEALGRVNYKILAAGIFGYRQSKAAGLKLYPHARLALSELLRMGIKMAILSDAPRMQAWLRVYALGVAEYFDYVITFDDTMERKPSPKPFLKALDALKLNCDEVVMIGDWIERDMVGAKSIGIKTIYAAYGDCMSKKPSGADYDVSDIFEIINIIKKLNNIV